MTNPAPPAVTTGRQSLFKRQPMILPIIVIALGTLVLAVMLGANLINNPNPSIAVLAMLLSGGVSIIGILLLRVLDRWEPEPPHLLLAAFAWGGGVSLVLVLVFSAVLPLPQNEFLSAAIGAPLTEESAKGLFLVLVVLTSRRGRSELNTLTDALVYAGFVGIGFSFIEDILYISDTKSYGDALTLAGVRLGLGAFSHSIYTAMTAIGIWKGVTSRGAMRFIWPFLGWCVAVFLHGAHNASTISTGAYFLEILLIGFPAVVILVVVAIISRRREAKVIRKQLPAMVHFGWITESEAGWLDNLKSRRQQLSSAGSGDEKKRLKAFSDNATELAFVRDRLDAEQERRQPLSPELLAHHQELVNLLQANASLVSAQLAAQGQGWPPVQGRQTPYYPGQSTEPGRVGPGQMGPGQMGPGQMGPGQMGPGQMGPGPRG